MALQKPITLKNNFGDDVTFSQAYIRVNQLTGDKHQIMIDVSIHKLRDQQIVDSKNYLFTPDLEGKNFIAQAYDFIKTLPEFAGSIDC
jgi:hypothetical protein